MSENITGVKFISSLEDNKENPILKKHNTAETSRQSFIIVNNNGTRLKEKFLIYEAIKKYQPVTSRMLSSLVHRERGNITRSLFDLVNEVIPAIKVAYTAKCLVTKRMVKHYTLINWEDGKLF